MKLVLAYIRPERLSAVKQALFHRKIHNMSVTNVLGAGRQLSFMETYRGVMTEVTLHKKIRLEIGVNNDYVSTVIDGIKEGARSGEPGDGVVFVLDIGEAIRIRTDETGPDAMG